MLLLLLLYGLTYFAQIGFPTCLQKQLALQGGWTIGRLEKLKTIIDDPKEDSKAERAKPIVRVNSIKLNETLDPLLKAAVNEAFAEVHYIIAAFEIERSSSGRPASGIDKAKQHTAKLETFQTIMLYSITIISFGEQNSIR